MITLKKYSLTILLVCLITLAWLLNYCLKDFTNTIDKSIAVLADYENRYNFILLKGQLAKLNQKANEYSVKPQTREEAIISILEYADYLKKTHNVTAQSDRPVDDNGILSLNISFSASFKSSAEFIKFLKSMVNKTKPVAVIEKLTISESTEGFHQSSFELKLIEPYMDK